MNKRCCGRPMISKGMLGEAKNNAAWNIDQLAAYAEKGMPIVGLEPSCLLTLRDEYPEFLRTDDAKRVAENSFLLEEFLLNEQNAGRYPSTSGPGAARHCSTATAIRRLWSEPHRQSRFSSRQALKSAKSTQAAAAWPAPSASKKSTTICR